MNRFSEAEIREVVKRVVAGLAPEGCPEVGWSVPVEISARHVHLNQAALAALFGPDHALTPKRPLSQPGQFLSEERVTLVTSKGQIANVAVLGPVRKEVQVELSLTDSRTLGLHPPIRLSGDLTGAEDVFVVGPKGMIEAKGSVIVAQAHIHMLPADAQKYGVSDGELVDVRLDGVRSATIHNVAIRVRSDFSLAMHIDYDEANAAGVGPSAVGTVAHKCASGLRTGSGKNAAAPPSPCDVRSVSGLVTEADALHLAQQGGPVHLAAGTILTPSARDVFLHAQIALVQDR